MYIISRVANRLSTRNIAVKEGLDCAHLQLNGIKTSFSSLSVVLGTRQCFSPLKGRSTPAKKPFIQTNSLSLPTLNKCGWFVAILQILSEAG